MKTILALALVVVALTACEYPGYALGGGTPYWRTQHADFYHNHYLGVPPGGRRSSYRK